MRCLKCEVILGQALRPYLSGTVSSEDELCHLSNVEISRQAFALQSVCSESKKLGLKIVEQIGRSCTLGEVIELLLQSQVFCFAGEWKYDNHRLSRYLVRTNCSKISGLFGCDYWREAVCGLVAGLTKNIEFSRHRSLGHGDLECFQVLYTSPAVNREWGVVPGYITNALSSYTGMLKDSGIELTLEGYSEGVVFYRLEGKEVSFCGAHRISVITQLLHEVYRRFPELKMVDVTPRTGIWGMDKKPRGIYETSHAASKRVYDKSAAYDRSRYSTH